MAAIRSGRIVFWQGKFTGKLNSELSKELRAIGAKFSRATGSYHLTKDLLPPDLLSEVATSRVMLQRKVKAMQIQMLGMSAATSAISQKFSASGIVGKVVTKMHSQIKKSLKGVAIAPQLSPDARDQLTEEYNQNFQRDIKGMADKTLEGLREKIEKFYYDGGRATDLEATLVKDYNLTKKASQIYCPSRA